ncbi:tetratricopeptide repeat protein [Algisphaera agarilytica]|uniref:Tetratricopeptide (TPR) repeat protein n=1 Tax=Algisphaera agarilytica TaxID=1385975 RepID=A0A7X0LJF8_9BACT|nr:tetratricopeptide repeat protein [Algisphaera agarilytica]MBB6429300.1 tetratricopeptide (TPR) repeat protein [Algisphaera agarilytica]
MAGKVNTKFVFILAAVLVVLLAGGLFVVSTVLKKSSSELEAEGDNYLVRAQNAQIDVTADPEDLAQAQQQRGQDYRLAAQSYGKAWNRDPQNVDLLIKYIEARSNMTVRDQFEAKRVLGEIMQLTRQTTELRPDDEQMLEDYYQLLYRWAREFNIGSFYNDLYSLASTRLETKPDNIPALKFRGISQAVQISDAMDRTRQQEIRQDLETVLQARPGDTDVLYYLARWHLYDANRTERSAPDSDHAKDARAQTAELAERALAADPDNPSVKIEYFNVMLALLEAHRQRIRKSSNDEERAEAAQSYRDGFAKIEPVLNNLEAALLQNPEPPLVVQQVAEILPRVDKQLAVMDLLIAGESVESAPKNTPNHLDRTERLLRSASAARPDMLLYKLMLANVLKLQLQLDDAHEIYLLARDYPIAGNFEASLRDQVLRQQAVYEVANIELIRAEAATDPERRTQLLADADKAVDELEAVTDKDARVLMLRGKLALLRNETTHAMVFIDQASTLYQDRDIEALLLSARARQAEQQWGAAVERLERVLELVQGGSREDIQMNIRLQLAEMLLRSRKLPEAREQISIVLESEPNNTVAIRLLAQWYTIDKQYDKAIALLEPLKDTDPAVATTLAQLYGSTGQADRSREMLRAEFEKNPTDLNLLQRTLQSTESTDEKFALLDEAEASGALSSAITMLRSQLQSQVDQTPMTLDEMVAHIDKTDASELDRSIRKAQIYLQNNEIEKSREAFKVAQKIEPDNDKVLILAFDLAVRDKEFDQARRLAATAGKRNLDLAEGHFLRGQLAAAEGKLQQALSSYDLALKQRPVFDEGWRQYADLLLRAEDPSEAIEAYGTSLEQKPDNINALAGLARAYNSMGRHSQALDTLRDAVSYRPNDQVLLGQYLTYEQRFGDPATVRRVRMEMVESQPENIQNLLSLAILHAEAGETEEALALIDQAEKVQGVQLNTVAARAGTLRLSERVDEGKKVISDYIAQRGDEVTTEDYLLLARYHLTSREFNEALTVYNQAVAIEDPAAQPASRELADVLFNAGRLDESVNIYQSLFDGSAEDQKTVLGSRLAESLLRLNRVDEAVAVLDQLQPTATTDALRAMAANQNGDRQKALDYVNASLGKNSRNPLTYVQRASLLAINPETQANALDDVQQALQINPDMVNALALQAQIQAALGQDNEAAYSLRLLLDKAPGNNVARRRLAQLYLNQQRIDEAEQLIREGLELEPGNPTWLELSAGVSASRGNIPQAIASLEQLVAANPTSQSLSQLSLLYLQANRAGDAQALLEQHPEAISTSPELQGVRGSVLVALGQTEPAQRVFALALQRSSSIGEVSTVLRQMISSLGQAQATALAESVTDMKDPSWIGLTLANQSLAEQDYSGALQRLDTLRQQVPASNSSTHILIERMAGLAMLQNRDFEGAKEAYLRLLDIDPDNIEVLNNLAYILSHHLDKPDEALPMAQRAAEQAPTNAEILDTLGWIQYQLGNTENARATLERSVQARPIPANTLHLGRVYLETGNSRRARPLFEQCIELAEQAGDAETADRARSFMKQL